MTDGTFSSSASIFDGSLPPASAKSGRPPPPPPTIGAISLTMRPAWIRAGQILRHRDDERDLAVVLRRDHDDAAAEAIAQRIRRGRAAPPFRAR